MVTQKAKVLITQELCQQSWTEVYKTTNLEQKVELFHNKIKDIFNKHCPVRNVKVKMGKTHLENPVTIKPRRLKDKLYKNDHSHKSWKMIGNILTSEYRELQRTFARNNINKVAKGSKNWWKGVKSITDSTSTDPKSHKSKHFIDGKWLSDEDFVEKQHDYFQSLANPTSSKTTNPTIQSDSSRMSTTTASIAEVYHLLRRIDTSKATNSNDFPSWISKNNAESLCIPLAHIINAALAEDTFPTLWKSAEICPLPKTSAPERHSEYRPISLLWHCGKLLEHFVTKAVRDTPIKPNQYAYTTGRGCTDALVNFVTDAVLSLDQKNCHGIHALLIDYSKAFDNMNHQLLIDKMYHMGIDQKTINITKSFLTDRTASVIVRSSNTKSKPKSVDIGVPQGSLLGPALWNIFVDDMPENTAKLVKYADDTTAYVKIKKCNSSALQKCADEIAEWSSKNQLTLNTGKTKSMTLNLKTPPTTEAIRIDQIEIEDVDSFRLLGVTLDTHITFAPHVENITGTCRSKCHGLTKMKRYGVDKNSLVLAYRANILSVVKYAAPAWYPYVTENSKLQLESIQKLALKIIYPEMDHYEQRLYAAKLEKLNDDLEMTCIIYTQKKADIHCDVLPKSKPQQRRSQRLSASTTQTIAHHTAKASKCPFIKYGKLL